VFCKELKIEARGEKADGLETVIMVKSSTGESKSVSFAKAARYFAVNQNSKTKLTTNPADHKINVFSISTYIIPYFTGCFESFLFADYHKTGRKNKCIQRNRGATAREPVKTGPPQKHRARQQQAGNHIDWAKF